MAKKKRVDVWLDEEQIKKLALIHSRKSTAIRMCVDKLISDYENGELVKSEDNTKA